MGYFVVMCKQVVNLSYSFQSQPPLTKHTQLFQPTIKYPHPLSSNTNNKFKLKSSNEDQFTMSASSAYQVLDVMPNCSLLDLKAAFRAKVCIPIYKS